MITQFMPLIIKAVLPKAADHIAKVFKLKELRQEVKDLKKAKMEQSLQIDAIKTFLKDMQDERS
tara:strand:- start:525 stop:716 length:192 start_codon:yes stop_codon:yes gene_type:complete